jgi:hypothetical protein
MTAQTASKDNPYRDMIGRRTTMSEAAKIKHLEVYDARLRKVGCDPEGDDPSHLSTGKALCQHLCMKLYPEKTERREKLSTFSKF